LFSTFSDTLANMLQAHNDCCAISRLTSDILASIFCLVPTRNHADIGSVCRRWHEVLYQNPRIWSMIDFKGCYGPPDVLKRMLAFSAQAPLYLNLRISSSHHKDSCQALAANMHRCVTLQVTISHRLPGHAEQYIMHALRVAAPQLVELRLQDQFGVVQNNDFNTTKLLGGSAPRLQLVKVRCDLDDVPWPTKPPRFPSVKKVMFNSSTGVVGISHLRNILKMFPRVVELTCEFTDWVVEEGVESRLSLPRTLQSLVIIADAASSDVSAVLNTMETRDTQEIRVSFKVGAISDNSGDILRTLHNIPAPSKRDAACRTFITRTMSFEYSAFSEKSINVHMLEEEVDISDRSPRGVPDSLVEGQRSGSFMRSVMNLGHHATLEPACFAGVRRLELTEMGFDPTIIGKALPSMPELVHLTIFLLRFKSHALFKITSGFVAPALSGSHSPGHAGESKTRFLACPKLRVLRIGAPVLDTPSQPVARLEPCMVTGFVRSHLRFDAAKLDELQFNSIEMFVSDPLEFEAILQLSRETIWDERHLAWGIKTCKLLDWS